MKKSRAYISVYFEDARSHGKKKGDITLAFDPDDALYMKIKTLGSTEIKKIMGINTYQELLEAAQKEDRSRGNFVKHRLRVHFGNEEENTSG